MNGIYKFENKINHMIYIGQSINLEERYKKHKQNIYDKNHTEEFYKGLREYGWDNFTYEILESFDDYSLERLNKLEVYYIKKYNCIYPNGYNMNPGGSNGEGLSKGKQVEQYSLSGEYIKTYPSAHQAGYDNNIGYGNICACCRHERNYAGNYQWRYKEDNHKDLKVYEVIVEEKYGNIIQQFDKNNNLIQEFDSIAKAHNITGIHAGNISTCCKEQRRTAGGFYWRKERRLKEKKEKIILKGEKKHEG